MGQLGAKLLAWLARPRVLGPVLLVAFIALRLWDPAPVQFLRLRAFDAYQQLAPRPPAENPTLVIAIDDDSLAKYGQWPWPRSLIARLVDRLAEAGPAAIAVSIVFAEPDRLSSGSPSNDEILADAIINAPVVLGRGARPQEARRSAIPLPPPIAEIGEDPRRFLVAFPALVRNLAVLESVAAGNGIFTLGSEPDGVVRRIPALIRVGRDIFPALSIEALRVAAGETTTLVRTGPRGVESIRVGAVEIPTDTRGRIWPHFAPPDARRVLSAADVLDNGLPPDAVRGRTVVIGATAVGQAPLVPTPVSGAMSGVEIHAQLIDMAQAGAFLSRPDFATGAEIALTALAMTFIVLVVPALGAVWTLVVGALSAAVLWAISWGLFIGLGMLLDVTYPALASFLLFLLLSYLNYSREERGRRQVRSAFAQYLAPSVVAELAEHPERLQLGGENRELSVLFCDIRGFTTLAERLNEDPQRLTQLLTRLLTPVTETILSHRGTIDKYIGDSVMAFWNAPLEDPDHAARACAAALGILDDVRQVNSELAAETAESGIPAETLSMGLGINSGSCVVGNLGTPRRFAYSAIGDTVNLAARLEGQTRTYGVDIILGEVTAARVEDRFAVLELDRLTAKGRRSANLIYALLGDSKHRADPSFAQLQQTQAEMLMAYRNQDWDTTTRLLDACRSILGAPQALYNLYEDRIAAYRVVPPPAHWDGTFVATTK